jgi:hypothetical protein
MVLNIADWVDGFAIFPLLILMTKECIPVNNPDNNADFLIPSSIGLFSNECIIKGRGMSPNVLPDHYPKTWARLIKVEHNASSFMPRLIYAMRIVQLNCLAKYGVNRQLTLGSDQTR